ncbi:MAG: hypothetical protein IPK08_12855 [Bacteroidetes bacterium]|nr:hypothetical protein [Bacteroidota bacterium]
MNILKLINSKIKLSLCCLLCSSVLITSCNLINPDEDAPAYIEIEKITFDPTPTLAEMGPSSSVKIKDAWIYVDNEFIGAFELPARFPVLKNGSAKVLVSPGIFLNGIASTRSPYPFYNASISTIDLPANGTVKISPVTSYLDATECKYCESFEGAGFSMTATAQSDTVMYQLPAGDLNIFEGNSSGVIYLDTANTIFEVTSTSDYELPGAGAAVYLEFDYKINQSMQTGLYVTLPDGSNPQVQLLTLNPTDTWNKIYIQLGYTVSAYASATGFKVYFGALKSEDVANPVFYLDNIKVVSF